MTGQQESDEEAFARAYAQHRRRVHAYVARRVGTSDAEEVTAEVFLTAWRRWPDPAVAGLPWLYTTAQFVVSTFLRSRQRYDQALQHLAAVSRCEPGDATEASADRVVAARALLALRDADRDLLLAVAWDGLTTGELAAVLGCSTATVSVRLHRARRRLDAALRAHDSRPDPEMERTT